MSSSHSTPRSGGASTLGDDDTRRKRPWWILALAAVVAIIVLLLLLSQCGGDDGDANDSSSSSPSAASESADASPSTPPASPSASASAAPTPAPSQTPAPGAAGAGAGDTVLTSGGTSLLPTSAAPQPAALTTYVGKPAEAKGVAVLSVPADEGFFVGTSDSDRVWVQLTGTGESGYQVVAGDLIDFTATVVANKPGFAQSAGLTKPEGAARLKAAGGHLEADRATVQLSQP